MSSDMSDHGVSGSSAVGYDDGSIHCYDLLALLDSQLPVTSGVVSAVVNGTTVNIICTTNPENSTDVQLYGKNGSGGTFQPLAGADSLSVLGVGTAGYDHTITLDDNWFYYLTSQGFDGPVNTSTVSVNNTGLGGVFFSDDFSSGTLSGFDDVGTAVEVVANDVGAPYSARCYYAAGDIGVQSRYLYTNSPNGIYEVYTEITYKFDPAYANAKFCKLHGTPNGSGHYANMTFAPKSNGKLIILMGDDHSNFRDAQVNVDSSGNWSANRATEQPNGVATPYGSGDVFHYDNLWHKLRVYAKFGSNYDGAVEIWDEDTRRLVISGISNRSASHNGIGRLGIFDYSGTVDAHPTNTYMSFRKVEMSTSGWAT